MTGTKNSAADEKVIDECNVASTYLWDINAAINCIVLRDRGEVTAAALWRHVMLGQQSENYRSGMRKLGIKDSDPPAIKAAKYHYLSNTVGGLRLHYIEESDKKAWIRYLAPLGSYPGMSMLISPISLRRTILSTWHPRNGELMGCPRLGWVLTKLVCFGHPYDEGYFIEYDHDLKPDDRVRFEYVEKTPEFDPSKVPQLPAGEWPEVRVAKASRNYAAGYVRSTVEGLRILLGEKPAAHICHAAASCLAVQFTPELCRVTGVSGNDVAAIVALIGRILASIGDDFEIEKVDAKRTRLHVRTFKPFAGAETPELREAFFQFYVVAARMLNGHIKMTRHDAETGGRVTQTWDIEDTGRWLW